jgi:hypothetical protein
MYDLETNSVHIYRRVIILSVMDSNPANKQVFAFISTEEYYQTGLSLTLHKHLLWAPEVKSTAAHFNNFKDYRTDYVYKLK